MAGGVPAGRLEIEILADVARLHQDIERVKRLVKAGSADIAASARAANDNLAGIGRNAGSGIKHFSRDVAALKSALDPAWAALQRYKREVQTLQQALREGAITHKQYVDQLRNAVSVYRGTGQVVAATNGSMRAGMQQLSYQLGDIATQFAMGAPPMQIFAAQASQVVGAVGLMANGAKGFIGFLGGPWGQIIIGAVTVLGTLGAGLLGAGDSATDAAKKTDRYTDALLRMMTAAGRATAADIGFNKVRLAQQEGQLRQLDQQIAGAQGTRAGRQRRGPLMEQRKALENEIFNLQATIAGTEKAVAAQRRLDDITRSTATSTKSATATRREHNKELREGEKAALAAAKAHQELANWLDQTLGHIAERVRDWTDDMPSFLEQETEAAEAVARVREGQLDNEQRLLDVYLQQVDAIRQMGGLFDGIGGILQGMATGNLAGLSGKLGGLLGAIGSVNTGVMAETTRGLGGVELKEPEKLGESIGAHLEKVFRDNGPFMQAFKSILANAAIGSTAAGLVGGNKLGGALGGALGGKLGEKVLGPVMTKAFGETLGSLAGPLGSIAGGLLGGVVGGLFKPAPKYGTSRLYMDEYGQLGGTKATGNDAASQRAATSLAGGVGKGLMSIAETLGAKITGVPTNIVLGTFDGKYRVNTEGRGGKMDYKGNSAKGLHNFGDDQQAAIEFAIQKSIEGAVLTGISQASINILKSGQDLQAAIEKATLIESIPKELQRRLDPVGHAIDELNRKWMKTVDALREGEATSQQMADAQKLYNMELLEAKDSAGQASQALKDFLKSMNIGANSPLSLRDQAMSAKSALDPFLAQINAGQSINQDKYLEAAQSYLDIERQMFGSTAKYFEAFDMIQAATNKAIATVDNAAPIRTTSDPFIEQTATATKSMAASAENQVLLLQQNVDLQKENNALLKKLAEKQTSWTGQDRNFVTRNYG